MNHESLRHQIEALAPWHHDIELAPGITTMNLRSATEEDARFVEHYSPDLMMSRIFDAVYPEGLAGRSFLDCACNSGAHSIAAAKAGAGRVFGFDARQHWIDQAEFLARTLNFPNVSFSRLELRDLPAVQSEPFDITLFAGIFYHLPDPVAGLRIAADLTRELLIVNTSVIPRRGKGLVLSRESDTHVLSGVDGLAWLPTGPAVMQDILAWCGFPHSRIDLYWSQPGTRGWKRLQIIAARDRDVLSAYDIAKPHAMKPPTLARRVGRRIYSALRRH